MDFDKKWAERNPGYTPEISGKIKIKEKLCKIKKFKEADAMQAEIDKLKKEHLDNWNSKIKAKSYEEELKNIKKGKKWKWIYLIKK